MSETTRATCTLLAAITLWGSAFTAIAIGLEAYAPTSVALGRFLSASIVLLLIAWRRRTPLPTRAEWPRLAVVSLAGITAYHVLLNVGQQVVPPTIAALLIQTAPVFTALLAWVWLGSRLRPLGWLGILIASAGAGIIVVSRGDLTGFSWGAALIVGAAVVTSIYFVGQQPLAQARGGFTVTVWSLTVGMVPLLVFLPALVREAAAAPVEATAAVVYAGVFPGALGYLLWNSGLRVLGPTRATVFLYGSPLVALATEWGWRGTQPGWMAAVGGVLAIAGVALVNRSSRPAGA